MAIRFRSAWNNRRFKSDLWLWTFSVGGVVIVHDIWTLWIASKKIRHGGNSRFVYRNGFARSPGHRLSHLPKDKRPINVRAGEHFIVDLVGEYRHCHRLAAGLVRARRAAFAPYDAWFFAVSGANRHIFPRRVCLPRAIHAQRSYHVRDELDRARHLYRRSGYPMAFGADTRSSNIARGISIVTV